MYNNKKVIVKYLDGSEKEFEAMIECSEYLGIGQKTLTKICRYYEKPSERPIRSTVLKVLKIESIKYLDK